MKKVRFFLIAFSLLLPRTFGHTVVETSAAPQMILSAARTSAASRGKPGAISGRDQGERYTRTAPILVDGTVYPRTVTGVNAAIAAARTGQTVVIPTSFSLSGPIAMNREGVTLRCANGVLLNLADGVNSDLVDVSASSTRITGCIFDGNSAKQTTARYGINVSSSRVSHVCIDHNQIQNTSSEGIRISNASYLRIIQNKLMNNGPPVASSFAIDYTMEGPRATSESFVTISENDINESSSMTGGINIAANIANGVIRDWHIDRNSIIVGDNGLNVELGVQAFTGALPGNIVADGTVDGNIVSAATATNTSIWGISVGLAGVDYGNVVVSGNRIRDTRSVCIEGIGSGLTITKNSCDDTDGIQIPSNSASVNGISVVSNMVKNGSGANSTLAQIGISGSPGFSIRGVVVCDNLILDVPTNRSAIVFNGNPTGKIVDSLVCNNVVSGRSSGMSKNAIDMGYSTNISIKGNRFRDWNGIGTVAVNVGAGDVRSTTVMDNTYQNVTATWADSGKSTLIRDSSRISFSSLGPEANGSQIECANCRTTNPCTPAGAGATARRVNGAWVCD
jgi:hypothetical protein